MDIQNELIAYAKELGIKMSAAQAEKFQLYLDLLLERNEQVNLTAITDPHEAVIKHFVDSLTLLKAVEIKAGAKVIDVGTGAGFPGVPVKIMRPDVELTLLDGANKRLSFLKDVCTALKLDATYLHKRAEEAGRDTSLRESFDLVTARAVASMNTLVEYCIPLVKMKGVFAAMKGPGMAEEMQGAERAISLLGCHTVRTVSFTLPDEQQSERNIAVMQKTEFTPKEYPRHGGTITKKPLFAPPVQKEGGVK